MATASGSGDVLQPSEGKTRFVRLARLLRCGGTKVMRELFDYKIPPANLAAKLSSHHVKTRLKFLNNKNIITSPQWEKLYPSSGAGPVQSKSFDITLLFKLLREKKISGLSQPSEGWDKLPNTGDFSLPADMARIKYYRNTFAHETMELSEQEFSDNWEEIKDALVRIVDHYAVSGSSTVTDWEKEIDRLLTDPLTEDDRNNVEELKLWYSEERELKEIVKDTNEVVIETNEIVRSIHSIQKSSEEQLKKKSESKDFIVRCDVRIPDVPIISIRVDEALDAVDEILKRYNTGQLKEDLQKVLITEELKSLTNGESIELSVELNEEQLMNIRELLVREKAKQASVNLFCVLHRKTSHLIINRLENSLKISEEAGDKEMAAYITLGVVSLKKEEYDDAILYIKKFLAIAQESGDKLAEMNAYIMLGFSHFTKQEYDDAILYSKQSLDITQKSNNKEAMMHVYMTLGEAYMKKGEYDDAIAYSKKWLHIAQESGDKEPEMAAYMMLGDVHLKKEEYDDAIAYSEKWLHIAQESGDKEPEMAAYKLLGVVNLKKEECDDAISYYQKSLTIAQGYGDKVAEAEKMELYLALGVVYWKTNKYDDAYSCLTKGKKIATGLQDDKLISFFDSYFSMIYKEVGIDMPNEYESVQNTLVDAAARGNIFQPDTFRWVASYLMYIHHRREHDYEQAISHLKEAESIVETIQNGKGSIQCRKKRWLCKNGISEMHVLKGQYDEGMQYQQEALKVALTKAEKAKSHFSLGQIYYKLEQLDNAERSLEESLKYYEFMFDDLKQNDRFKIAFVDKYKTAYKMLLKVLIEKNKKEEALVLSDLYRAKALKDLLVSSHGMVQEPTSREDLQYADFQSLVSSRNYSLLLYSTCFEKLCTFIVEAGNELEFSVQHFEYCDTCLDRLVRMAFDDILRVCYEDRGENPTEDSDESSLTIALEILYHKLIKNIKCLIKQDEIVIIPEGPLYKVPFAALRDPDTGQYLSETKRIRMAPSMATLKLLQEYPEEHHSSKEALIIGGPVTGPVMLDGVKTEFGRLYGAIEEADEIAQLFGVQPFLGGMATKPAVIKRLQEGASVVHIAAYGNLEKGTIVLAPSPEIRATKIPDEEDYMLTMADVQQAQVRAQLVVLSYCDSGRGQIKAEGVVGMCRAFLASGARAVMGSLWNVDDEATRMFMETFYKYLKDGKSASTSLHLTMNDTRRTPEYSEPKYWAPFYLMGDDVTIKFED